MFGNQTHLVGQIPQQQQQPLTSQQHQFKRNPPNNYQRYPPNNNNSGNNIASINPLPQISTNVGDFPQGPGRSIQYRNHSNPIQIQPTIQGNTGYVNPSNMNTVYNHNTMGQNFSNVNNQHLQHQHPHQSMAPMNIEQFPNDNPIPIPSSTDLNNLISQI